VSSLHSNHPKIFPGKVDNPLRKFMMCSIVSNEDINQTHDALYKKVNSLDVVLKRKIS